MIVSVTDANSRLIGPCPTMVAIGSDGKDGKDMPTMVVVSSSGEVLTLAGQRIDLAANGVVPYSVALPELTFLENTLAVEELSSNLIVRGLSAANGPQGARGSIPLENPIAGNRGSDGNWNRRRGQAVEFGKAAPYAFLSMLLRRAESLYLDEAGGGIREAHQLLHWIASVTEALPINVPVTLVDQSAKEQIGIRARTLLAQLAAGLDLWGNPRNAVPLLTLEAYQKYVSDILPTAQRIEASYTDFFSAGEDRQRRIAATSKAISASEEVDLRDNAQKEKLAETLSLLSADIRALVEQISNEELQLTKAAAAFRNAVEAKSGCSFIDVLKGAASIVAISSGAWTSAKDLWSQLKDLKSKDLSFKDVVKKIELVGKDLQSIGDGYNKIKDILAQSGAQSAQLMMAVDEADEAIKPYLDMPEARNYQAHIRHYRSLCQARNERMQEYTAATLQLMSLMALAIQRQAERSALKDALSSGADPLLSQMVSFLARAYDEVRAMLSRAIVMENRAFEYWSLRTSPLSIANLKIFQLEWAHTQVYQKAFDAKNSLINLPGNLDWKELDLSIVAKPEDIQAFKGSASAAPTGVLFFTIPIGSWKALQGYYGLRVTNARIRLDGASTDDSTLKYQLIHLGVSMFEKSSGQIVLFSHLKRVLTTEYDISKGTDGTTDMHTSDQYIAPSPYATWCLLVSPRYNSNLKLSRVKAIRLSLRLKYQ